MKTVRDEKLEIDRRECTKTDTDSDWKVVSNKMDKSITVLVGAGSDILFMENI